jgi:pyruvate/2-oxoglutarate dehydrogenase complex dihydrolipoamide acyltransferase (E2) component
MNMANNTSPLTIFAPGAVPAHVKAAQDAGATNIVTRAQVDALTFPGKVWTVNIGGTKTPLVRHNADGEEELVQTFEAVIIAYNENRGRAYYASQVYDPNETKAPVCWSNDGITSDPNSSERQSEKCNVCSRAIKGSRQTDEGKAAVACRVHRHLAVIPRSKDLASAPVLRLKIPQTSDFDGLNKEAQAKGLFAFTNYLNFLKSKNVPFTYSLSTKIRFDNSKSYPKLWFSPGQWLTEDQAAACAELAGAPSLGDLLKTDYAGWDAAQRPPGITEEDEVEDEGEEVQHVAPPPAPAAAASKPALAPAPATAPKPSAAPAVVATNGKGGKTAAQKKAEAAAAAATARKTAVLVDEDDEVIEMPPTAATRASTPAPAPTPAPAAAGSPALDKILTDWDDE